MEEEREVRRKREIEKEGTRQEMGNESRKNRRKDGGEERSACKLK